MKNRFTNSKGITIITLVITIIVMLILIGVGLKILIDSDLIGMTEETVNKTSNKIAQQQNGVDNLMGELQIIVQRQCDHEWGEWNIIRETTCGLAGEKKHICMKCNKIETAKIAPLPHTFVDGVCTVCEHELLLGAYIYGYDPSVAENGSRINTRYISKGSKTGGTETTDGTSGNGYGDQSFSVESITNWRVLKEENGQIIITTAGTITTDEKVGFCFERQAGYMNFIEELDKVCSIYGQGKYADTSKFTYNLNGIILSSGGRSIKTENVTSSEITTTESKIYTKNEEGYICVDGEVSTNEKFIYWGEDANPSKGKEWIELTSDDTDGVTIINYWHVRERGTNLQESMWWWESDGNQLPQYYFANRFIECKEGYVNLCVLRSYNTNPYRWIVCRTDQTTYKAQYNVRPIVYLRIDLPLEYDEETQSYTIFE